MALACCTSPFATITRAAAKSAASRLRSLGLLKTQSDWTARATICERCPLRVLRGGVSYCGTPFLDDPLRDAATEGCGCPTKAKARDPHEHCPLDAHHRPAVTSVATGCTCKWCAAVLKAPVSAAAR